MTASEYATKYSRDVLKQMLEIHHTIISKCLEHKPHFNPTLKKHESEVKVLRKALLHYKKLRQN